MKLATVTGWDSANNLIFIIPLDVWRMTKFCRISHLRDRFSQKYWVFFSFLYPQQLIKNKKITLIKLKKNFLDSSILFPPNLRLEI